MVALTLAALLAPLLAPYDPTTPGALVTERLVGPSAVHPLGTDQAARDVLNGVLWILRTGAPWADIPERYGPHTTCVNRFNRWRKAGVWDRLLDAVSKAYDGDIQMIDSSSIRVHQHAANAKKKTTDPVAWVARGAG